jgi:hypothetical protein
METQQYEKALRPAGKPGPKPKGTPAPAPSSDTARPQVRDAARARQAYEMRERGAQHWAIADALFPELSRADHRSEKIRAKVNRLMQKGRMLS